MGIPHFSEEGVVGPVQLNRWCPLDLLQALLPGSKLRSVQGLPQAIPVTYTNTNQEMTDLEPPTSRLPQSKPLVRALYCI